jgi:hypothetical protein
MATAKALTVPAPERVRRRPMMLHPARLLGILVAIADPRATWRAVRASWEELPADADWNRYAR